MSKILGIKLDERKNLPLYRQLVEAMSERIRSGALPPGYRLPPTRDLALQLGVHRNTVVKAFEELGVLGYVIATVGRGTFVGEPKEWGGSRQEAKERVEATGKNVHALPWDALFSSAMDAEPLSRSSRLLGSGGGRDCIDLASMEPPRECLPVELFRRCVEHVLRTRGGKALSYAPREGVLRLRECIVEDLAEKGIPTSAEDIVITTGSQQGLDLVVRTLLDPGDAMLLQSTTYTGALNIISVSGGRAIGIPEDKEGPSMHILSKLGNLRLKGFYLMPNVCNPTGICISAQRREALLDWSHASGVPLIEDDYACDLELDGEEPPAALRALDPEVIYIGTYSKKLIPALRVGFLVCPEPFRARILPLKKAMDLGTSVLLQYALAEFLERGYLRAHLRILLPELQKRRDALEASLHKHLPAEIQWRHAPRGPLLWLRLPSSLRPEIVFEEARRQGVLVGPGSLYETGAGQSEGGIRLVFTTETPERLAEAGARLGRVFNGLLQQNARLKASTELSLDGA